MTNHTASRARLSDGRGGGRDSAALAVASGFLPSKADRQGLCISLTLCEEGDRVSLLGSPCQMVLVSSVIISVAGAASGTDSRDAWLLLALAAHTKGPTDAREPRWAAGRPPCPPRHAGAPPASVPSRRAAGPFRRHGSGLDKRESQRPHAPNGSPDDARCPKPSPCPGPRLRLHPAILGPQQNRGLLRQMPFPTRPPPKSPPRPVHS